MKTGYRDARKWKRNTATLPNGNNCPSGRFWAISRFQKSIGRIHLPIWRVGKVPDSRSKGHRFNSLEGHFKNEKLVGRAGRKRYLGRNNLGWDRNQQQRGFKGNSKKPPSKFPTRNHRRENPNETAARSNFRGFESVRNAKNIKSFPKTRVVNAVL